MFEETGMKIDKGHVKEVFRIYTDSYDITNEKIALKIGHTYRVADLCEQIAQSEGMGSEEQSLAWLLGMLHDIGTYCIASAVQTFRYHAASRSATQENNPPPQAAKNAQYPHKAH